MNVIETTGLRYAYEDGTQALRGLDFAAEKGRITGVLGANGAGKSTLFLCLNGILQPSSGQVLVEGQPVSYDRAGLRRLRQQVGIVFQDPDDQLFSADVYRDVSFGAVNLGLPEDEVRRRVDEALEAVDMTAFRDKPTHALSYGQRKRVAIAGVLVMRPQIMILDEPTAGLDPQGVDSILQLLRRLCEREGITIVVATHDMDILPLLCDDVYLLAEGRMAAKGSPQELFRRPELLRKYRLRLPRMAQLMEILHDKDNLMVDTGAATIEAARKEILRLMEE